MPTNSADLLVRHVRKLAGATDAASCSDRELLQRFAALHDEAAFAALLQRHGPMVLRVCRRVLHHTQDAEDVFQAAFLVLARKAGTQRWRDSVGSWLHEVATRLAQKARADIARRAARDRRAPVPEARDALAEITGRELLMLLDAELTRLPERYRAPLVLCCLEGHTRDEAARQLGWTVVTIANRLQRGRQLLRARLARRGLELPAVLGAFLLAEGEAPAAVSAELAQATLDASLRWAAGAMAGVSAQAAALAKGAPGTMWLTKMKLMAVLAAILGATAGAGAVFRHAPAAEEANSTPQAAAPASVDKQARADQYGDPLPPGAVARLGATRLRHEGIASVVVSRDGKTVASGGIGTIRVWDTTTGKELRCINDNNLWGEGVALSPDGETVAVGDVKGKIHLWDVSTGKERTTKAHEPFPVSSVVFSPDGKTLVSAGWDRTVGFWDVSTLKELLRGTCQDGTVGHIVFSPDGKFLASRSGDGSDHSIWLWDAATGQQLRQLKGHVSRVSSLAFSPDGKTLASGGDQGDFRARLWDVGTGKMLRELAPHDLCVKSVAFSPDGKTLALGDWGGAIRLREASTGKEFHFFQRHGYGIVALAFTADGKTLVSAGQDNTIRLWETATGKERLPLGGHLQSAKAIAFSPDGKTLATGSDDHSMHLWDAATGKEIRSFVGQKESCVYAVAFSPGGKTLASGGLGGIVRLWEVATGKELRKLGGHGRGVSTVAFSGDGRSLVVGSFDGPLRLWDVAKGEEIRQFESSRVASVAFSSDGKLLAAAGTKGIDLWEISTGKRLQHLSSNTSEVHCRSVSFSPDGRFLASAEQEIDKGKVEGAKEYDQTIRLWEVSTGKEVRQIQVFAGEVYSVAFSPDGKTFATGGSDDALCLWEAATGKRLRAFQVSRKGHVYSLSFSPDGKTLAAGGGDGTVLLWDLTSRAEAKSPSETPSPPILLPKDLERLWDDLAGDSPRAYRAIVALAAAPEKAVPFLGHQLRPATVDAKKVARLIADLDHEQFAVREKAASELEEMTDVAEADLRETLQGKPSLEVRRRIENLLEKQEKGAIPAEQLRRLRAVEVLERVDSSAAREVLSAVAQGVSTARLTREAKASLERLAAWSPAAPR
jgi:RNA polymerase sigma factor (sigma-70 family)